MYLIFYTLNLCGNNYSELKEEINDNLKRILSDKNKFFLKIKLFIILKIF